MQLTVHDSAESFLAATGAFLKMSEAENSIVTIAAARIVSRPTSEDSDAYFASVEHDGTVIAAALQGGAGGMLLTGAPAPAVTLLAADMSTRSRAPRSMVGPLDACEAFAREWARRTGQRHTFRFHLRHYELHQPPPSSRVRGRMRTPQTRERELLLAWQLAFVAETQLANDSGHAQRAFARRLQQGTIRVWDDDGVVALAGYGDGGTDVARIAPVFTPLEYRRRSYASALVGELSRELFENGKRAIFLTADVANATSNGIYCRIGFAAAADHYHFDFVAAPA